MGRGRLRLGGSVGLCLGNDLLIRLCPSIGRKSSRGRIRLRGRALLHRPFCARSKRRCGAIATLCWQRG